MLNTTALYDCFDSEWTAENLYRELAITDSKAVMAVLYQHRLIQLAFAMVLTPVNDHPETRFVQLLRTVASTNRPGRYARVILLSTDGSSALAEYVHFISKHLMDLLEERRVYTSTLNEDDYDAQGLALALGAAQPVYPEAGGEWRI